MPDLDSTPDDSILEDDAFPGETTAEDESNINDNVGDTEEIMADPPEVAAVEDGSDVEEVVEPPQEDQTPESPVEAAAEPGRSDEASEPVETPPAAQEEPESDILADTEPASEPPTTPEVPPVGEQTSLGDIEVAVPGDTMKDMLSVEDGKFLDAVQAPVGEHGDVVGPGAVEIRTLEIGEQVTMEVARYWDTMMAEISQPTRMAIWETGIADIQTLLSTPAESLVKPRGPLTPAMVEEVNAWFAPRGFRLPNKIVRARAALPPVVAGGGDKPATRQMTPQLAARRKEWIKGMKGGR